MENEIRDRIYNFFIESRDFNGIPLRQVSQEFNIDYKESIDLIKNLVSNNTAVSYTHLTLQTSDLV